MDTRSPDPNSAWVDETPKWYACCFVGIRGLRPSERGMRDHTPDQHGTPSSPPRPPFPSQIRFLPDETDVGTLAPALENAILDASDGEGASKLNFTRLNENIGALSEVKKKSVPGLRWVGDRKGSQASPLSRAVPPFYRCARYLAFTST